VLEQILALVAASDFEVVRTGPLWFAFHLVPTVNDFFDLNRLFIPEEAAGCLIRFGARVAFHADGSELHGTGGVEPGSAIQHREDQWAPRSVGGAATGATAQEALRSLRSVRFADSGRIALEGLSLRAMSPYSPRRHRTAFAASAVVSNAMYDTKVFPIAAADKPRKFSPCSAKAWVTLAP